MKAWILVGSAAMVTQCVHLWVDNFIYWSITFEELLIFVLVSSVQRYKDMHVKVNIRFIGVISYYYVHAHVRARRHAHKLSVDLQSQEKE